MDLTVLQRYAETVVATPQALTGFAGATAVVPGSVIIRQTTAAQYDPATGTIRFDMLVRGVVAPEIGDSEVKSAVQWKSTADAELALAARFPLRGPAEVRVSPGLMPRTALFGFRVKVEIDLAADSQPPDDAASPTLANTPANNTAR